MYFDKRIKALFYFDNDSRERFENEYQYFGWKTVVTPYGIIIGRDPIEWDIFKTLLKKVVMDYHLVEVKPGIFTNIESLIKQ